MSEILVIRKFDDFSRILMANGHQVNNCPTIRTEAMDDLSELDNFISNLETFDGIFITSSAAAKIFVERSGGRLANYNGRVFVLGSRSFDILNDAVKDVYFDAAASTAAQLLKSIDEEGLKGKRFLFIRGQRSMRTIPELLAGIADVEEVIVYRTLDVEVAEGQKKELVGKITSGKIAMTCFFSPSGVESFVQQFGNDILRHSGLATIGDTTASALRDFDLKPDVVSGTVDVEQFATDVMNYIDPIAEGVRI